MVCVRKRVFLLIILLLSLCVFIESSEDEVESILEEIQNEYNDFKIGEQKKFVLVLGNTGTGKSTVTLLITGAELESKRERPGVFSIVDKNDLISGESTTISKTKVPNLMIDNETSTTFYDCPGFADTRGVVIDITATRTIHDLLSYADEVKLLFTVSYNSVENKIGDRKSFRELAGHSVNLFKNVEKYRKGMSLVVTKVKNLEDYNDKDEKILVDDQTIIENIAGFLNQTKNDLEKGRSNKMTTEEQRVNEAKIKFTEIFLEREGDKYTRINIFRLVDRPGPLKKMKLIQNEKEAIQTMIHYNTEYVKTDDKDFGYSLSDESKTHVADLISKLDDQLGKYSENICNELNLFHDSQKLFFNSVENIKSDIDVDSLFQLNSNVDFVKRFNETVIGLGIELNADILKNVTTNVGFIDFLEIISKQQNSSLSTQIEDKMKICALGLFDKVKTKIRNDVPNAISNLRENYIEQDESDPEILNALETFFFYSARNESSEVNSTTLKPLLDIIPDKHFHKLSRNFEFLDFLQLLNDPDHMLSFHIFREMKLRIDDMHEHTENNISNGIDSILNAAKEFYLQKERQNYLKLEEMAETTAMIHKKLSQISTKSIDSFVNGLMNVIRDLKIENSIGNITRISRELEFLRIMHKDDAALFEKIVESLETCKKYFDDFQNWYNFLLDLRNFLLTYSAQNDTLRSEGSKLMVQSIDDGERSASEIGLKPILDALNDKRYSDVIENMKINVFKLKAVQALWSQTMADIKISCKSDDKLIVKGYVVLMSKVIEAECWSTAKFIDIFALNKVFIDVDVDKNRKQAAISIISPIWEIILSEIEKYEQKYKRISMIGEHGIDYTTAANNAKKNRENGEIGLPGRPGGPGGNFLGIGSLFINEQHLLIDVNGGHGGEGQRGGNGKRIWSCFEFGYFFHG